MFLCKLTFMIMIMMTGVSSVEELLSIESRYFSIAVTQHLSVEESLAVCYKVNVLVLCLVMIVVLYCNP